MTEETLKDRLVKTRDAAVRAIYHPTLVKISRFAADIFEASSIVDTKNPLSMVSAGMALVNSAVDAFDLPVVSPIEYYIDQHELMSYDGELHKIVLDAGLDKVFKVRSVMRVHPNPAIYLKEMSIDDNNKFYYLQTSGTSNKSEEVSLNGRYLCSKNFDFERLFDAIWRVYGDGIFLSKKGNAASFTLNSLKASENLYIGDMDVGDFAKDIISFRDNGISRSFMLVGSPGTGKSSFAINVAKELSKRVIKLDPSAARNMGNSDFDFLIDNLKPSCIIFDDFDRTASAHQSENLLFLLENLKVKNPDLVIFATVNDFYRLDKALVRPGRFDEIIWFDTPSAKTQDAILRAYLNKFGVEHDDSFVASVLEKTGDFSPAYIKELCLRISKRGKAILESTVCEFRRSTMSDESGSNIELSFDDLGEESEEEALIALQQQMEEEAQLAQEEEERALSIPLESDLAGIAKKIRRARKKKKKEEEVQ